MRAKRRFPRRRAYGQDAIATGSLIGKYCNVGDCDASVGDCDASVGDCDASVGDCDASVGDCDASVGDCDASVGDCDAPIKITAGDFVARRKLCFFNKF